MRFWSATDLSSNTSDTATLSMSPSITMPFVGGTAVWGYSATLSVGAIGTGLLSYQWFQENGVAIADATPPNPVFSLSSVQFTNGGPYSVVVSSDLGSVTNTALLVVNPAGTVMGMCASITITGVPGYTYVIQYTSDLAVTNSWITLTNLTLQAAGRTVGGHQHQCPGRPSSLLPSVAGAVRSGRSHSGRRAEGCRGYRAKSASGEFPKSDFTAGSDCRDFRARQTHRVCWFRLAWREPCPSGDEGVLGL